jgi:hypothetical protein
VGFEHHGIAAPSYEALGHFYIKKIGELLTAGLHFCI